MFSNWSKLAFYVLLILAVSCITGMYYLEYLYQTSASAGRNELREGWAFILTYSWPIFSAYVLIIAWMWEQLSRAEIGIGVAAVMVITAFFIWVAWA